MAPAAAALVLLEHVLSVVREAEVAGRAAVQDVSKYVMIGARATLGNRFSMAGTTLNARRKSLVGAWLMTRWVPARVMSLESAKLLVHVRCRPRWRPRRVSRLERGRRC